MENKFIPLSVPNVDGNEAIYTLDAVEAGWLAAGPYLSKFEQAVASYAGTSDAVGCQSGTAAIHLSLLAAGVNSDNEVIVPTLTFIASINPVVYVGANPIFMDCDDTLCMDMGKVRRFCEEECTFIDGKLINKSTQKHVSAMIPVHVFGNLCDMEAAMEIAEKYNLFILEDAAEAMGTYCLEGKYKGKHAGTIGDIGIYSFNGNKIITCGGGGMIVSNNQGILDRVRFLSTQAKDDEVYFLHSEIGYNYRMTNVQAALGFAQFELLEQFILHKKESYDFYEKSGIQLYPFRKDIRPNYWFYSHLSEDRDKLISHLQNSGIQSRPIWHLIHSLKPYREAVAYKIEKAVYYWERVVNIPCSTNLTSEDIGRVVAAIKEFEAE